MEDLLGNNGVMIQGPSSEGESLNGGNKKQSTPNLPKNNHFLTPDTYTHVCILWGINVYFSENLASFVFFLPSF